MNLVMETAGIVFLHLLQLTGMFKGKRINARNPISPKKMAVSMALMITHQLLPIL
jgi:hypothetical protein